MLLEVLIAIPVQAQTRTRLPTSLLQGLKNLLLEGHYHETTEIPVLGPGSALTRFYQLGRQLDPGGRLALHGGALEALDPLELTRPVPDLEELPSAWSRGLSDGNLYVQGSTPTLEFSISARFLTRVRMGEPAFRLSLRCVCRQLLPAPPARGASDEVGEQAAPDIRHSEPETRIPESADVVGAVLAGTDATRASNGTSAPSDPPPAQIPAPPPSWDESYEADLERSLADPASFSKLHAFLIEQGELLARQTVASLDIESSGSPETLCRVLILDSQDGAEGLFRGFSPEARRSVYTLARIFERQRPHVPQVFRRGIDGTLQVWRGADPEGRKEVAAHG